MPNRRFAPQVLLPALVLLALTMAVPRPAQAQAETAGWVIFNPSTLEVVYFSTLQAATDYMNSYNFFHLFETQITRIYTQAGWAELIAYWEGRVAAAEAAAAADAAVAAAGVGVGTVVGIGSAVVVVAAGGMICYYGYVANQNGCSVSDFCWQTMGNYFYYCKPWNW
jgi:hypothetical protein